MFTQAKTVRDNPLAESGARVITVEDIRWKRRDIKSVALLAQVLAKQAAAEAGVAEAWMVEDGAVTEGSSSTAFIVTRTAPSSPARSRLRSCPASPARAVMRLAAETGLAVEERLFSVEEATRRPKPSTPAPRPS